MGIKNWDLILLYIICGLVLFFLVAPVLIVIPISFSAAPYLEFPPRGFSLRWYQVLLDDPLWFRSLFNSIRVGVFTMLFASFLGTLASFAIIRGKFPGKDYFNAFLAMPMIMPRIVLAVALYMLFIRYGLVGNLWSVVLSHTVVTIPYVVANVSASLRVFDVDLEHAARTLGASKIKTFLYVTYPQIKPGIVAGALFAFVISFHELVLSMFILGRHFTLPKKMFDNIIVEIDPSIAAMSTILFVFSLLLLRFNIFTVGKDKRDAE